MRNSNSETINLENHFITSDFQLASTLATLGFELNFIDKDNPQRATFYFCQNKGLSETVESFFLGKALVDPRVFSMNQKLIKSRILQ